MKRAAVPSGRSCFTPSRTIPRQDRMHSALQQQTQVYWQHTKDNESSTAKASSQWHPVRSTQCDYAQHRLSKLFIPQQCPKRISECQKEGFIVYGGPQCVTISHTSVAMVVLVSPQVLH